MDPAHPDAQPASGLLPGQVALLAAAVGYGVLIAWQAFTLPDRVPGKVGPGGEVTRWASLGEHVALGVVSGLMLLVVFGGMMAAFRDPGRTAWVNVPHKEYWTRPENWPVAHRRLTNDMGWVGAAMLVFVGYTLFHSGQIARGEDPGMVTFWVLFGLLMAGVIGWGLWTQFSPSWRPPAR